MITFLGFGKLGYEDEMELAHKAREELERRSPREFIVNTGTLVALDGLRGIADVYSIARKMGFETTGIHPSFVLADRGKYALSAFVDQVFFVRDDQWCGFVGDSTLPCPTLQALVAVTNEVVAIGGGHHTAQEIHEFCRRRKPVRFHPAEMNREMGRDWVRHRGMLTGPLCGWAHDEWPFEGSGHPTY